MSAGVDANCDRNEGSAWVRRIRGSLLHCTDIFDLRIPDDASLGLGLAASRDAASADFAAAQAVDPAGEVVWERIIGKTTHGERMSGLMR